ncbi:MAG: hypothetical protein ACRBBW_03765 [Cellvibrionaceae bacterium]
MAVATDLTGPEQEAYARANPEINTLTALEVRHSEFPAPVRVIDGNKDRELLLPDEAPLNGGESVMFEGAKLSVPEETLDEDPDSQVTIQAAGVSGWVNRYLSAAAQSFEVAEVSQYRVTVNVVTDEILAITKQAELEVRSHEISMTATALVCGYTNTSNRELQV